MEGASLSSRAQGPAALSTSGAGFWGSGVAAGGLLMLSARGGACDGRWRALDVQAARGHVGGDQHGGLRGGEAAEHGLARVLRQLRGEQRRVDAVLGEELRDEGRRLDLVGEDEHAPLRRPRRVARRARLAGGGGDGACGGRGAVAQALEQPQQLARLLVLRSHHHVLRHLRGNAQLPPALDPRALVALLALVAALALLFEPGVRAAAVRAGGGRGCAQPEQEGAAQQALRRGVHGLREGGREEERLPRRAGG